LPTSRDAQAVRERFLREARAAAALRHPNVAAVYHFGASPDDTHCYYAMELVEGETLEALVRRDGPLDSKVALEIAIQIAGIDGCGGPRFDPSGPEARQYHVDARWN
jgi:Serine/threonine protein kinase